MGSLKQQRPLPVRVIRTPDAHEAALQRLSWLMDQNLESGSAEEAELELLAVVIEAYERTRISQSCIDAVDAIVFRMDQMGLTRNDLVPILGSASRVSEVLARKRPLSIGMIRRLHTALAIPADLLIADASTRRLDAVASVSRKTEPQRAHRGSSPHRATAPVTACLGK